MILILLPISLMKRIRLEIGIRIRYLGLMRMSYFGLLRRMKETADSKVPSSDLGAFERAASANDSTDTTQKFPTWKEMGFLRKGVGNHRRTSNLTVLSNLEPTTLHIPYCYRRHEYQLDYGTRTPEIGSEEGQYDPFEKEQKIQLSAGDFDFESHEPHSRKPTEQTCYF
ncbi:hypothetical protein PVK06_049919 [Gossypium arboreum]|uniref:Uncharacterized protein n=1 Tax=Gossypium arboreum TaxID=29729 RepID=A0ABR0MBX0_GOSAR|nr:hypothetical protein PVK06_049919 [Gossypium arboreum]